MVQLTPHECRVLGVMVEKAQTTPAQYPMTLNALITGSNQKNNRDPLLSLQEDQVLRALDGLRHKELAAEVHMAGSRVPKFRHLGRDGLGVNTSELVLLAEMLLRGPQTVGELRGRASRMHPLESVEAVQALLDHLMNRDEPMVKQHPPAPGSRAQRFGQLLCPDLHPIQTGPAVDGSSAGSQTAGGAPSHAGDAELTKRVATLEAEVASLRRDLSQLAEAVRGAQAR